MQNIISFFSFLSSLRNLLMGIMISVVLVAFPFVSLFFSVVCLLCVFVRL